MKRGKFYVKSLMERKLYVVNGILNGSITIYRGNLVDSNEWDEMMIVRARNGDTYAEEELLKKYKLQVRRKATSYFMVGADRDDVIQEGMIGVFKAIHRYDPQRGAKFSTFADLCITSQILSAVRSSLCQKHSPLNNSMSLNRPIQENNTESMSTLEDTIPSTASDNPEEFLVLRENLDAVEQGEIEFLSRYEAQVWRMYLDGKTYAEIAEISGKPIKTVDNAITRAKRKIRAILYSE